VLQTTLRHILEKIKKNQASRCLMSGVLNSEAISLAVWLPFMPANATLVFNSLL
jgi:hypothetical protein